MSAWNAQAADFALDQRLTLTGTTTSNRFGETVAASDTFMAVGSQLDDTLGTDAGAVYLYEKVAGTWTYRQKLMASDGAAGDQFGAALAIHGTTLTVGSPYDDIGSAVDAGSVYSFDLEEGTWLQTEKLAMPTPVSYDKFGLSIDMTAARLVVGVPGYNGATSATTYGRGAVTVWDRQSINWGNMYLYAYTSPVAATRLASFGYSVAISGDKIAVGAPRDYAATTGQGVSAGSMSVLAYNNTASTWASEARFFSTTPVSSDFYGNSVDIQGDTVVTANFAISTTAPKIFTYTYSTGSWSAPTVIVPTSITSKRYIAQAIEIAPDESSALVGSDVSYASTDAVGRVFVLKPNTSTGVWEQAQELASPDATNTTSVWFGHDVAYAGGSPVVASPMVSAVTGTRGAVYTYNTGDATPPTLILSSSSSQYLKAPYTVTIDASEPVVGFTQSDISITSGATLSNFTQVSATQFTVLVTPSGDGQYVMNIDAGKMQDVAGNGNTASPSLTRVYDTTTPTASVLTPAQSTSFTSSTISASVRVSDSNGGLTDLTADDISISNGVISDFSSTSNATSITGTFTITPIDQGTIAFSVKAGAVTDQAGNDSTASTVRTIFYDTNKPTPSFSTPLNPTNASPFPVTLSFDEPVADIGDVTASQVGITGGVIGNFQRVTAQQYTFDVTPAGLGTVTLGYAADQVSDKAGNTNNAATTLAVVFDNFGPEVNITPSGSATNQSPIIFTVTLSEPVSSLTVGDFNLVNGTGELAQTSTTTYSMSVTPAGNGDVSLSLPAQKATDEAGNGNQASNTATVKYDTVRPSVGITHSYTSPTNSSPLVFTVRFSEPVSELTAGGINITNGALASLVKVDAREYTLSITPEDGLVTVQVTTGAVIDAAGNTNTSDSSSVTSDRTAPTGTVNMRHTNITRPSVGGTVSESAETVKVTVEGKTFNATVNNTDHTWTVSAGLVGPLADGTYDVAVEITDLAGNTGNDTTADELIIDTDQPQVTLEAERAETNQNPMSFNLRSSRDISDLETTDFIVTNGTATEVVETSADTYVIRVIPQSQGRVTLQLKADTVVDAAGNTNPVSNTAESTYDTSSPHITLSGAMTPTKNSFVVTADVDELVEDLTISDVTVVRGLVTEVRKQAEQRYSISIQPTSEGTVSVQIAAGATVDQAGNPNIVSNTFTRTFDTTPPNAPTVNSQAVITRQPVVGGTFDSDHTNILRVVIGTQSFLSNQANSPIAMDGDDWSVDFTKLGMRLEYGVYDVHVTATDAAGNSSTDTTQDELVLKSPGEIIGTVDRKITAYTRPELSGTVDHQNAIVDVKILDNVYRAINNRDGTWILPVNTIDPLPDGTYDIELTLVDGNLEGSDTTRDELTIDTAAPQGTFTRIVTQDTSPRIYGTVDTSNTRVQVELEGTVYEASVLPDNRWVIEKGVVTPLAIGTHMALLHMQRNDKEAMETVRRAITVTGSVSTTPPPPEEDGPEKEPTPSGPVSESTEDPIAAKPSIDEGNNAPHGTLPPVVDKETVTQSQDENKSHEEKATASHESEAPSAVIAAICAVGVVGVSIFFLVGWKRKHKKDEDTLV